MKRPAMLESSATRLLLAAEEVFVERGLDRAKVEDVTTRAGLSKGAFYLHFDSKEAAFRQVVEGIVASMTAYVERALGDADAGDASSLQAHFERRLQTEARLFEYLWENRARMRLLLEGGKSAAFGHLIDAFADHARRSALRVLAWGVARGVYRSDVDVEVASLWLAGAYDRLARHVVSRDERPDVAALLRAMQRLVLHGLVSAGAARELEPPASGERPLGAALL